MGRSQSVARMLAGALACVTLSAAAAPLSAQSSRESPNVRLLDHEADRIHKEYLTDLTKLVQGYEDAGETEKAKRVLERILQLDPDAKEAKSKLEELDNLVFDTNSATVDVDVAKGWVLTGLTVESGRPVRFEAEGTYKYIVTATLGPDGFTTNDPKRDMAARIPCGQLMGWILPTSTPNPRGNKRQPPDLGRPFPIGAGAEITPNKSGLLVLRLNVPPGTNSNGKVRVTISGHITRSSRGG